MNNDKKRGFLKRFSIEIFFLSFCLISAAFAFFFSKTLTFSFGILLIYLVFSILLFIPLVKKNHKQKTKYDETYFFLCNFVSFYQRKSIEDAFSSAILSLNNFSLNLILERVSSLSFLEQLSYFEDYFSNPFYTSICDMLRKNSNPRKDFLIEIEPLINEVEKVKDTFLQEEEIKKKNWAAFCFCWFISFFLIAFLHLCLTSLFAIDSLRKITLVLYSFYFGTLLFSVTFFLVCSCENQERIRPTKLEQKIEKHSLGFYHKRKKLLIFASFINTLCFLAALCLFFKNVRLLFSLLPLILVFLLDVIIFLHLRSLKRNEKKRVTKEVFFFLTMLEIYLKAKFPFMEALSKSVPFMSEEFGGRITALINSHESDKIDDRFISFANAFSFQGMNDLILSLYLVYKNPHKKEQLERFSFLLSESKTQFEIKGNRGKYAYLSAFQWFPLLATATVLLLIFARIGNLIGGFLHG